MKSIEIKGTVRTDCFIFRWFLFMNGLFDRDVELIV